MLAMNFRGPYRVRADEKPMPTDPAPGGRDRQGDALVHLRLDLHLYHGMVPDTRVGMTFGHEFCGIVEQVGPEIRNLKVGDHVLVPFNIACGRCTSAAGAVRQLP
jgi:threonine dehydrogenase-like Zn-dependent dehydrogenase